MSANSSTPSTSSSPPAPDAQIDHAASLTYWNSISADVNGMLGGFPQVSRIDLQFSRNFIAQVRRQLTKSKSTSTSTSTSTTRSTSSTSTPTAHKYSLGVDCGAGIGRITSGLLTDICSVVDIVEPIPKFAEVLASSPLKTQHLIGDIYVTGLESWTPTKKYDLVWNQWCVGHLTDAQLVAYLRRVGQALSETGWICVKENLSTARDGADLYDEVDSSVTRSDAKFCALFEEAGMEVVRRAVQTGIPRDLGLYPVKMYALRPR